MVLGTIAKELALEQKKLFPCRSGAFIAATSQGWLGLWGHNGRVWPTTWTVVEDILPLIDVLILSHDDLLPFANGNRSDAEAILTQLSFKVPLLVATDWWQGATLFQHGMIEGFPIYHTVEIDLTGVGDIFAASFLIYLYRNSDLHVSLIYQLPSLVLTRT